MNLFRFSRMDPVINYAHQNFVNEQLRNLEKATFWEILNNPTFREIYAKFIQHQHIGDSESTIILKRWILSGKIIKNVNIIWDSIVFEEIINLCPSYEWETRMTNARKTEDYKNFRGMMKNLKWETFIEMILHNDYARFMRAKQNKSRLIKQIMNEIYARN